MSQIDQLHLNQWWTKRLWLHQPTGVVDLIIRPRDSKPLEVILAGLSQLGIKAMKYDRSTAIMLYERKLKRLQTARVKYKQIRIYPFESTSEKTAT